MLLTGTLRISGSFDDVLGTAAVIEGADNKLGVILDPILAFFFVRSSPIF